MNTKRNNLKVRLFNLLYYLDHFKLKEAHIPGRDPIMLTANLLSRSFYFSSNQERETENDEWEDPSHIIEKQVNNFEFSDQLDLPNLKKKSSF